MLLKTRALPVNWCMDGFDTTGLDDSAIRSQVAMEDSNAALLVFRCRPRINDIIFHKGLGFQHFLDGVTRDRDLGIINLILDGL